MGKENIEIEEVRKKIKHMIPSSSDHHRKLGVIKEPVYDYMVGV